MNPSEELFRFGSISLPFISAAIDSSSIIYQDLDAHVTKKHSLVVFTSHPPFPSFFLLLHCT
jgi:hypothetical protein